MAGDFGSDFAETTTTNLFLALPLLVTNEILDYVGLDDWKNLRATCRSSKIWVEQPRYLHKFKVYVTTDRLAQVMNSSVPWTNLAFPQNHSWDEPLKRELLTKFRPSLKHLTIGSTREYYSLFTNCLLDNYLCHLGPEVETLELIGHFHLRPKPEPNEGEDHDMLDRNRLHNLRLQGITHLKVIANPVGTDWLWPILEALLEVCPNLTRVDYPTWAHSRDRNYPSHKKNPFIAYLKKLGQKPVHQRPSKFVLNLSSDLAHLDSGRIRECSLNLAQLFPLATQTLLELAELCHPIGGKLQNVPLTALPTLEQAELDLAPACLNFLNSSVQSVLCWDRDSGVGNVYLPPQASLYVSYEIERREDLSHVKLPAETNLSHLVLFSPSSRNYEEWMSYRPHGNVGFISTVFLNVRPTVTTLSISNCLLPMKLRPAHTYDLGKYFPNLQKLILFKFYEHEKFLEDLVQTLPPTLVELRLEGCTFVQGLYYFNRRWSPLLTRLKKLAQVTILQGNKRLRRMGPVLDLRTVFAQMTLKSFTYEYDPNWVY